MFYLAKVKNGDRVYNALVDGASWYIRLSDPLTDEEATKLVEDYSYWVEDSPNRENDQEEWEPGISLRVDKIADDFEIILSVCLSDFEQGNEFIDKFLESV